MLPRISRLLILLLHKKKSMLPEIFPARSELSYLLYSNGSIEGENGAHITGDVVVAGGITILPSVEWATHNTDQFFATASSNRDIAQSLTAASEGNLAKVSVYLGKVGAPSGNITLKIANDNSGKPSTGNIASATIPNSSVGATPSWIDVSFSSSPNLTNGNKYWIVLDYGSHFTNNFSYIGR